VLEGRTHRQARRDLECRHLSWLRASRKSSPSPDLTHQWSRACIWRLHTFTLEYPNMMRRMHRAPQGSSQSFGFAHREGTSRGCTTFSAMAPSATYRVEGHCAARGQQSHAGGIRLAGAGHRPAFQRQPVCRTQSRHGEWQKNCSRTVLDRRRRSAAFSLPTRPSPSNGCGAKSKSQIRKHPLPYKREVSSGVTSH